jgi:hypothetical protein
MAISADGTQIKVNGKMFTLSKDADTREKQFKTYQQYALSDNVENKLNEIPIPEKKYKMSVELIEKRYQQCRQQEDETVADGDKPTPNYALCEKYRKRLYEENEIKDKQEAAETSKGETADPVPSAEAIPTTQPATKETVVVENGTTKSTTQAIQSTPVAEKPKAPVSSPSGNTPVASTQPATYSQQANSNTASGKVHILNVQKQSKANHQEVLTKVAEDLIPTESSIKAGGNQITSYEKDKHVSIGAVINTFPCIRKDASGEFRPKTISVEGKGSFVNYAPTSYTEEVENSRFPCGTYSLNVGNKYDVSVGAGGANISTGGNMRLGSKGRTLITATEEMNVASGNGNVNIRAGHNISLKGDSLTLETPNQVVVNANLGVAKNAIINGCAFVDGELYVNHITCPAEVQYTGGGIGSFGQLMVGAGPSGSQKGNGGGGAIIGYADVSFIKKLLETPLGDSRGGVHRYSWSGPDKIPVLVLPDSSTPLASNVGNTAASNPEYSVFVYPHSHPFNNIPLSFTTGNEQMRARASVVNSGNIGTAAPIQHGYKTHTA